MRSLLDPKAYQRITSGGRFVPEVDGIRFVAIATVIGLHLNTHFKRTFEAAIANGYVGSTVDQVFTLGDTGVEIFFALSGFILALPFCRAHAARAPRVDIGRYYLRRLTRLEPPFIVSVLVIFALLLGARMATLPDALPHLLATLTYTHAIAYGEWSTINPVTWSLETEVQFYIVAPLLALLFAVRDGRLRIAFLVAAWVASTLVPDKATLAGYNLQYSLAAYLHTFLVGFLFCELYVHHEALLRGRHWAFDVAGVAAIVGVFVLRSDQRVVFDLLLLSFLVAVFKGSTLNRMLTNPWVTAIGGACYSLYLLHYATIFVAMSATQAIVLPSLAATLVIQFALATGAVLVIGMAFFRWVERPFMRPTWPGELGQQVRRSVARMRPAS